MSDREELIERVLGRGDRDDDAAHARVLADLAQEQGDKAVLAAALDRAFGLAPHDEQLRRLRAQVLNELAIEEHGLVFRYVPAGTFLMGSADGDVDERPVHAVRVPAFWISDVPVSMADYWRLMGWGPDGPPRQNAPNEGWYVQYKIRFQYCDSAIEEAGRGRATHGPHDYGSKPLVAVSWESAATVGSRLSTETVQYGLPTEAEWERAARGGRIGARYAWGDEPPDPTRCDCARFGKFSLLPSRELPPNDFGLFAMCGGVSEWTFDRYDALAYHPRRPAPSFPADAPRVLRGGSFADDEEAVTVSFRASLTSTQGASTPTVGFRLVRRAPPDPQLAWSPPPTEEPRVTRSAPAPTAASSTEKTWWQRLLGR